VHFLGDQLTPSGLVPEDNAYVLNVKTEQGGYLDGLALYDGGDAPASDNRRLDENPSACAHLVNHSVRRANVTVSFFCWENIIMGNVDALVSQDGDDIDDSRYYRPPNVVRSDGFPWFCAGDRIVRYGDGNRKGSGRTNCCGAVLLAKRNLRPSEELLLDYSLRRPLPQWARSWYEESH